MEIITYITEEILKEFQGKNTQKQEQRRKGWRFVRVFVSKTDPFQEMFSVF